jgi:hypothetical protein
MKGEDRIRLLCAAFGWQGGTVHQVAEQTGCDSHDLIYADLPPELDADFKGGWFAIRTCDREWNERVNWPNNRGNLHFWFGVAAGQNLIELGE